jgi:hypothetical protein
MLSKRAESAPAGVGAGRAPALAWAGLKLAAVVLLAAGVGVGLGDGDEFDDVGCSVAQQPGGTSHGACSAQARERAGGKLPGSDGGSAGASGSDGPGGRPECEARSPTGETFPINLLKQVLDSTLEQQAVIRRILDGQALPELQQRPPLSDEAGLAAPPETSESDEPNLSLAVKVFELLTALDPANRLRKAPPIKVFNLYYRQRLGPAEIARKCKCDRSLIYDRLAAIQEKIPWSPEQLHDVSPHVQAMEEALADARAKGIYRKGAAYGEEADNQGDD